jgi:hypothetical protein
VPYWQFQIVNFISAFVWAGVLLTMGDVLSAFHRRMLGWSNIDHQLTFPATGGGNSSRIAKPSSLLNNWPIAPLS